MKFISLLREKASGTATTQDDEKMAELKVQADALRTELVGLMDLKM